MKKTISIFISVMMIVALICIVPAQAETKTEGLDNNAPSKTDIINYLQDHKDEISTNYKTEYEKAFTKREDASSYDLDDMGTLTEDNQKRALARLNLMRYLAGVDPVTLDSDYEEKAQASAYVNYLNNEMSHFPKQPSGASDDLYNLAKDGSSNANISYNIFASEKEMNESNLSEDVDSWLSDTDSVNISEVGHRRWCLNPKMGKTGFGRAGGYGDTGVYKDYGLNYESHSSVYSHDRSHKGKQTGISWPAANMPVYYFSSDDEWSYISTTALDADDVTVTLTLKESYASTPGKTWTITTDSSSDGYLFTVKQYDYDIGSDAVIFLPKDIHIYAGDVYNVKITGTNRTIDYDVNFFLPDETEKFELDSDKLNSNGELVLPEETKDYDLSKLLKFDPDQTKIQYVKVTNSDESVATVSDLKLTAKKIGETELTFEIMDGKKLTLPVKIISKIAKLPEGPTLTYNGKEQNGLVLNDAVDQYKLIWGPLVKTSATDVGNYSYYVKPKEGFTWANGARYYEEVKWRIVRADNEAEKSDVTNPTYPNKPSVDVKLKFKDDDKTIEYKKADEDDYEYDTRVPTTPGDYIVRVSTYRDDNVNAFEATKNFTIYKGSIDTDQIKMEDQTVTYDGKDHSDDVKVEDENDDYSCSYTIKNSNGDQVDEAVDAGKYEVTAKITKKENGDYYNTATKTATLTIEPKKVSLPKLTTEFTYDGEEHSICDDIDTDIISVDHEKATKAGTHTATFTLKNKNYCWEDGSTGTKDIDYTIVPKKITLPKMKTEFTYNGKEQSICDEEDAKAAGVKIEKGSATDAGTYEATVRLLDPDNTTFSDGSTKPKPVEYTINKKEIDLPELTTEMTYNGEEQAICDETDGLTIEHRTATDAGTYTATFKLDKNHIWKDGSTKDKYRDYTIKRKEIELPKLTTKMTYNGEEQEICDKTDGLTIENRTAKDAGTYTATFTLKNKNYCWEDGSTDPKKEKYTINPKKITLPEMTTDFTYNGKEQSICDEDDAEKDGIKIENGTATDAGEYKATVSLLDKDNTTFDDGSTDPQPVKYEIKKKQISLPEMKTDLTYNGEEQSICGEIDGVKVEGEKATKAGQYEATFTVKDQENTELSNGKTSDTIKYMIKKKTIALPEMKTSFTYNGNEQSICDDVDGVKIENGKATNAGDYEATISLVDSENTCFEDGTSDAKTVKYTITKPADVTPTPTPTPAPTPTPTVPDTNNTSNKTETQSNTQKPSSNTPAASNTTASAQQTFNTNVQKVTQRITALNNDRDIANSSFGKIQLRASKVAKNSITIRWNKVSGANSYMIYGNKCGTKYRLITQSKGASYTQKKLNKGTYYKYLVIAVNSQGTQIAASKLIHVATKGSKYGNVKSIKVNKTRLTLRKKKQYKLRVRVVKDNKKMRTHRGITYESSNAKVATVNSRGTIKANAKGKTTIYIYAQNGYFKKVNVTVK